MFWTLPILLTLLLGVSGYFIGSRRAAQWRMRGFTPHSLPSYYGYYLVSGMASMLLLLLGAVLLGVVARFSPLAILLAGSAGIGLAYWKISPDFQARIHVERAARYVLIACALLSVLITATIVLSVLFESIRFFKLVPMGDFLFGTHWSPQQAGSGNEGAQAGFGAVPLFAGTLLITLVAMAVAVPVGLFAAIYMAEYASRRMRSIAKPMLEMLAGIPTVVYGYFAIVALAPLLRQAGTAAGIPVAAESALAAGLVMGVMIVPFMSSLSDDIITAVPRSLRDAAYGMGATSAEVIKGVVLPAALPGIMGAVLLSISRAIGETMIVVMAAGLAANLTLNPLESVTTVTAQIVALLTGDQEFDNAKTLAAFALGLALFAVTLVLNIVALIIVRKYREKYD